MSAQFVGQIAQALFVVLLRLPEQFRLALRLTGSELRLQVEGEVRQEQRPQARADGAENPVHGQVSRK